MIFLCETMHHQQNKIKSSLFVDIYTIFGISIKYARVWQYLEQKKKRIFGFSKQIKKLVVIKITPFESQVE